MALLITPIEPVDATNAPAPIPITDDATKVDITINPNGVGPSTIVDISLQGAQQAGLVTSPADTNEDGTVSATEQAAYDVTRNAATIRIYSPADANQDGNITGAEQIAFDVKEAVQAYGTIQQAK